MSVSATRRWWGRAKPVLLPVIGFGAGWLSFTAAEHYGLISPRMQRQLHLRNLQLQLYAQRWLPSGVRERYGVDEEVLTRLIAQLKEDQDGLHGLSGGTRVGFEDVLRDCAPADQIHFLEEHALEDIPYFYIADIFHAWANLHGRELYDPTVGARHGKQDDGDSEVLCTAVWEKTLTNVLPFDVSVRVLALLARSSPRNAQRLARTVDVTRLLQLYDAHHKKIEEDEARAETDLVPMDDITIATLLLLQSLNNAQVRRYSIPLLGAKSTGPYPLASRVSREVWCDGVARSATPAPLRARLAPDTTRFVDGMFDRLRCAEERHAVAGDA